MSKRLSSQQKQLISGVITFLDVLGWKGIWQRKTDAIEDLRSLARYVNEFTSKRTRGITDSQSGQIVESTRVIIISDTLVIASPSSEERAQSTIELHGEICSFIIPDSIRKGIPLRGATTYGKFLIDSADSIVVGPAIDEAASWHEAGDWIGDFMAPSAAYLFLGFLSRYWRSYVPPLKNNLKLNTYVVDWYTNLAQADKSFEPHFAALSPIFPEFVNKFENTRQYMKAMNRPDSTNANGS